MTQLTYEKLRAATAGGSVALRSKTTLQPADGPGGKVFPPSYRPPEGATHKYAMEERQVGDKVVQTVLLDSVASQANRAELGLLEGWESKELGFPVPYIDFKVDPDIADLDKLTVLEAPHRIVDGAFRDSLLDGTLFRLSEIGVAITNSSVRNAAAPYRYSPTSLLFGIWDSTGPKGGLGTKFPRVFVSEIVGHDAKVGVSVSSRMDPLQIARDAAVIYHHADPAKMWTPDPDKAMQEKGKPKKFKDGRPSSIVHGNQPPLIDATHGGVTISKAIQTTVLSLAGIRRLRFPGYSPDAAVAARTAIAALGVAAISYQHENDHDLRSRCLLIPERAPRIELVGRDGSVTEMAAISREAAAAIVQEAATQSERLGLGWETEEIRLEPAPDMIRLVRESRALALARN